MPKAAAVSRRTRNERKDRPAALNLSEEGSGFNRSFGKLTESAAVAKARIAKNRNARRQP